MPPYVRYVRVIFPTTLRYFAVRWPHDMTKINYVKLLTTEVNKSQHSQTQRITIKPSRR